MVFRALCLSLLYGSGLAKFESWKVTFLEDAAQRMGAVCLDGTAFAYYIEEGVGSGRDKWMVHFQGGGWCIDLQDCVRRSKTWLGSSKTWLADKDTALDTGDGGAHGLFSNDSTVNPDFYNWNKVYARYCDGGSWAGDVAEPVVVNRKGKNKLRSKKTTIYFRGGRILNALLDDLLSKGLQSASDLLVGGCSAGGLTVWLHLDYIRSRVPSSVRVAGVPQCGLFMDLPGYDGEPAYSPLYQHVYEMMNVGGSNTISSTCLASYPKQEQWRCFMAQYAMPFVETPFFVVNSFYDSWQWNNVLRLPRTCGSSTFKNCTSQEVAAVHGLRDSMLGNLSSIPEASGYFTYSCVTHCSFLNRDYWATLEAGGMNLPTALREWYFHGASVRIGAATEEPNANPSCARAFEKRLPNILSKSAAFENRFLV